MAAVADGPPPRDINSSVPAVIVIRIPPSTSEWPERIVAMYSGAA